MRVGLYHSLLDWHHPHFRIDRNHPLRRHPDREALNAVRDQGLYADYLHNQVRELLTEYGQIDIMWFDHSYVMEDGKGHADWKSEQLLQLVRELAPNIILDDRLDLPYGWDMKTPEQIHPRGMMHVDGHPVVWEECQTFGDAWGYYRNEANWKSVEMLVQMLIDTVSKGGNLLLNVGPTGRGEIDERALDRLQGIGAWMKRHNRSIYGCTEAPAGIATPQDCRLTYNPATNRLYVHVFAWPALHLHLDGLADKVEYAQLLNDASEVKMLTATQWNAFNLQNNTDTLTLELPIQKPNITVPVIELFLK